MHAQQTEFCQRVLDAHPRYRSGVRVLDCGSLDINGSNRQLFREPFTYVGIDLGPGKNVDVVCCASQFSSEPFDVVVSTEMLEHCKVWKDALWNMVNLLKPGGLMLLTWAGPGRGAHGVGSSSPGDSPYTNDYYGELSAQEVEMVLQPARWSGDFLLETRSSPADVYFYGVKS